MPTPRATFPLNATNAHVSFHVRWFGVVRVRGSFGVVGGMIEGLGDDARITVFVDSQSVLTGIGLRDRHLRGMRFLDSGKHPRIEFVSERASRHNGVWDVQGTLSLRGLDRTIALSVLDEPAFSTDRRLTAQFSVPRQPHAIGTAGGIRRLNPLLWAIGSDVQVRVEILVPATMLAPEPARAH